MLPNVLKSSSVNNDLIFPSVLKQGDTVGVISPSTAVSDPDDIAKAKEALDYFGLKMKMAPHVIRGAGYKSRTVDERLEDLHNMFRDREIKAVFCIRGGYGSGQLLDKIDYELIKNNPKIFLGYSDITAMHLAIHKFSNLITFHGPVLLSSFSTFTTTNFQKALFTTEPLGTLTNPDSQSNFRKLHPTRCIRSGTAKGKLIGGNLTLVCSTLGTPYEIDTQGKILFLEDVGEEPYRIDRMLTQLWLSKKLQAASGIVFGECSGCNYDKLESSRVWDYSFGEVLDFHLSRLNTPVFSGLMFGHTSEQLTLPIGVEAEINSEIGSLTILESGVK